MKKLIALVLVLSLCLSLTACGGNKKAFEASKLAYEQIDIAYEITDEISRDIYEVWRLAIYEEDEIVKGGAKYLASKLHLNEEELRRGIAYATLLHDGEDWDSKTEEEIEDLCSRADGFLKAASNLKSLKFFSFCTWCVDDAYLLNGKMEEAQTALDNAKSMMRELSEKYSDYEHYPSLKGYYTTTSAFFDFCESPTGSFEQVKDTLNKYRNEARDYVGDLDYIFED